MTQNIYDNPDFFTGYSQLGRSIDGLAGAAEWPALQAMLPDLGGSSVLDLGCGFGWFCRFARGAGATRVLGVDVSANMLERARRDTQDDGIGYEQGDLESYAPPDAAFDLVYSSLAFHYVVQLGDLFQRIYRALKPGGAFVFSVEHPIYTAPSAPDWSSDATGKRIWPLDQYLVEGPRRTDWLAKGVIKQHRLIGTTVNLLLRAGFAIRRLEEWRPSDQQLAARPDLAEELDRPMFLLISAAK